MEKCAEVDGFDRKLINLINGGWCWVSVVIGGKDLGRVLVLPIFRKHCVMI